MKNAVLIEGVETKELVFHADERGRLMEILRRDDDCFDLFGQVYITTAYPGVVKAWHLHHVQADNIACIVGMIKLVLFDNRMNRVSTGVVNEFFIGEHSPMLVHIPANVWHGFKCISDHEAMIMNCATQPYNGMDPDEHREVPDGGGFIPYKWGRKDG